MPRLLSQAPAVTRALALVLALLVVGFQALESGHVHQSSELATDCLLCQSHAPLAVASLVPLLATLWLVLAAGLPQRLRACRLWRAPQQARAPPISA